MIFLPDPLRVKFEEQKAVERAREYAPQEQGYGPATQRFQDGYIQGVRDLYDFMMRMIREDERDLRDQVYTALTTQKVSSSRGGCWYCKTTTKPMAFSLEWDAFVHVGCVRKRLTEKPDDEEAKIFAREFKL